MDNNDTRTRILRVSARLFAEKGFDGTRVDEIAKEAHINKAAIYYYFDSKNQILSVLFQQLIDNAINLVNFAYKEDSANFSPAKHHHLTSEEYLRFLEDNADLMKIMAMESMKSTNESTLLFQFTDIILKNEITAMTAKGINLDKEKTQLYITEFFLSVLPSISYSIYKEKLESYFGLGEGELKKRFIDTIDSIQNLYHESIKNK